MKYRSLAMESHPLHRRTLFSPEAERRLIFFDGKTQSAENQKSLEGQDKPETTTKPVEFDPLMLDTPVGMAKEMRESEKACVDQAGKQSRNMQLIMERWQDNFLRQLPDQNAAKDFMEATGGQWKEGQNVLRTIGPDGNWLLWKDKFVLSKDPAIRNIPQEQKEAAMQRLHTAHFKYNYDLQIAYAHGLMPGMPQFQRWKMDTIYYINSELAPYNIHVINAPGPHLDWDVGKGESKGDFGFNGALENFRKNPTDENLMALLKAAIEAAQKQSTEKKDTKNQTDAKKDLKALDDKINERLKEKKLEGDVGKLRDTLKTEKEEKDGAMAKIEKEDLPNAQKAVKAADGKVKNLELQLSRAESKDKQEISTQLAKAKTAQKMLQEKRDTLKKESRDLQNMLDRCDNRIKNAAINKELADLHKKLGLLGLYAVSEDGTAQILEEGRLSKLLGKKKGDTFDLHDLTEAQRKAEEKPGNIEKKN